jgi:formylglycine-generating enzyme required for sulfatase activity
VTGNGPQIVGRKPCNNWNLYDCHGNVTEWCLDWYLTTPYAENSEQTDPPGPRSDDAGAPTKRVYRGGYYNTGNTAARSAFRDGGGPNDYVEWAGFRLKCAAVAK